MTQTQAALRLMDEFGESTGVTSDAASRRYLWTDSFAVCNWLGLGEGDRARTLIYQVHETLGRHRPDDPRDGWLSGLPEAQGAEHPTAGGLRIGKPLPERGEDEPYDPRVEWDRDGQYFHYLTRWIHALDRAATELRADRYRRWAAELGAVAFRRFGHGVGPVPSQLYWKMSVDLSRPVVPSTGLHDPLDGYVVLNRLRAGGASEPALDHAIDALVGMTQGVDWATDDPLGAGSLLTTALELARVPPARAPQRTRVLRRVLEAATRSLRQVGDTRITDLPATQRLPFRELGLAIGLAAAQRLAAGADDLGLDAQDADRARDLAGFHELGREITAFWGDPAARRAHTWTEHEDINRVMLATALAPQGYLG